MTMNVREKILEIVSLQGSINHIMHHAPSIDADITATQEFRQEIVALRTLHHNAVEGLVDYVIRLEENQRD